MRKPVTNPPAVQERIAKIQAEYEQRLGNLAQEMAVAGVQVLQEQFGFTVDQATAWLDAMLKQAKTNRGTE